MLANNKDYCHSISKAIYFVIESGKASLEVEALTLSVSIESILIEEMSSAYRITPELCKNIDIVKNIVSGSSELDNDFKMRVMGSLNAMKSARAKDILSTLRDNGMIESDIVKTYAKLRNKSAHGAKSSGADMQDYFNQVSAVTVLFYQLVFLVVSYNGEYTDYGTYGYPTKNFRAMQP